MELGLPLIDLLTEHQVPGVAVGIIDETGTSHVVAAGTRGEGLGPVDDRTVFAAASLSKPVFATGVLTLVYDGVLELDRPLVEYLATPYLATDDRATAITARMVLCHTTGFPNWREDGPLYLRWAPGERWGYSGEGFSYLQQVVEHLVGTTLDRFLTEAVFAPLGMEDSGFVPDERNTDQLASGHDREGGGRRPFRPPMYKAAAGGLFTTASDYVRTLQHLLVHEHRMFETQVRIDEGLAWGLGLGIEETPGNPYGWQWGNDPGYKNFVLGRPGDRTGLVVFTNGDNGAEVYGAIVRELFPGEHPALDTMSRPRWLMGMARRLDDFGDRLDDPRIRALVRAGATPGLDRAEVVIARLRESDAWLLGIDVQASWEGARPVPGTPIACIGLVPTGSQSAEIVTLSVLPEWDGQGAVAHLVFGACEQLGLRALHAMVSAERLPMFTREGFSVEGDREDVYTCSLRLP
jgi:CubicO group peptidase (beta-lactamase class C family)